MKQGQHPWGSAPGFQLFQGVYVENVSAERFVVLKCSLWRVSEQIVWCFPSVLLAVKVHVLQAEQTYLIHFLPHGAAIRMCVNASVDLGDPALPDSSKENIQTFKAKLLTFWSANFQHACCLICIYANFQ